MSFKIIGVIGLLVLSGCYTKEPDRYLKKHETFLLKADKLCNSTGGVFGYGSSFSTRHRYRVKCYDGEIYDLFTEKPLINRIKINYRGSKDGE